MNRILASLCAFLLTGTALWAQSIDLQAYSRCTGYAQSKEPPPPEAIETCRGLAREGLPGAQYALAFILLAQSTSGPPPEAIEWLEKAVAAGHPPAAHLLATLYLRLYLRDDRQDLQARGTELLRSAICSGYPPAQEMRSLIAPSDGRLDCPDFAPFSFDGRWSASLKWVQEPPASGPAPVLGLTLSRGKATVFMHSGEEWVEVKPGKFEVRQADDSVVISALDSGWDLEGKWVESWTLHLLRLSDQEALVHFIRTVNNLHVPPSSNLKVLTSMAEGKATRSSE